ncbi:hypothetical protein EJB05_28513, partial [Eragrostis curvula]
LTTQANTPVNKTFSAFTPGIEANRFLYSSSRRRRGGSCVGLSVRHLSEMTPSAGRPTLTPAIGPLLPAALLQLLHGPTCLIISSYTSELGLASNFISAAKSLHSQQLQLAS